MPPQRLSPVDTAYLATESPATPNHIGQLTLFERTPDGALTYDRVLELVRERIGLVPTLRRRLAEVPFGLDRPSLVDDAELDLEFHVRHTAVPPPGDDRQLADLVARVHSRPLDRSRPLWELYVIDGLPDGRVGLYTKVHLVAVDAVQGTEILTALLDTEPEGRHVEPVDWHPEPMPTGLQLLSQAGVRLARRPTRIIALERQLLGRFTRAIESQMPTARNAMVETMQRTVGFEVIGRLLRSPAPNDDSAAPARAPRVSFNRRITPHRRFAFASIPFSTIHDVKQAKGTTVHDVVMAICAGALREWLRNRQELPSEPLVAMVPVLVRGGGRRPGEDDHISSMMAPLPTNVVDPLQRLALASKAMRAAKEQHAAVPATLMQDMARHAPPAVVALAGRLVGTIGMDDIVSPTFNLTISNVPGPRHPLYCLGAPVVASYPLSIVRDGVGLHIAVMSSGGRLHFGLAACRESMPGLWELAHGLAAAADELHAAIGVGEGTRRAPRTKAR